MTNRYSSQRILLLAVSVLTIFGLLMVYSASSVVASLKWGSSSYYVLRQVAYAAIGYFLMILLMNVDYHVWGKKKTAVRLTVFSLVSLTLVFTQPVIKGAHRWLRFGNFLSFQPSELAKLVLLTCLALFLHKHELEIHRPGRPLLYCLLLVSSFVGLIGAEPDFGQALCLCFMAALMLFVAGLSWKYFATATLVLIPTMSLVIWKVPYLWTRIQTYWDPSRASLGAGWQIKQAKIAIGSGGFFGLGLGAGIQKLFFLPEPHGDFVFAVIGEELGWIGTSLVALTFLVYLFGGLRAACRAPDRFGFYLGLGITLMIVLPSLVNMSMVLALLPTKGIALPFISQGGTSLLLNLIATGILLNISISPREIEAEADSASMA